MKLLCFGLAREIIGTADCKLENTEIQTVGELKTYLKTEYPDFNSYKEFKIAVNQAFAHDSTPVSQSDEIAIIPPVSGG